MKPEAKERVAANCYNDSLLLFEDSSFYDVLERAQASDRVELLTAFIAETRFAFLGYSLAHSLTLFAMGSSSGRCMYFANFHEGR